MLVIFGGGGSFRYTCIRIYICRMYIDMVGVGAVFRFFCGFYFFFVYETFFFSEVYVVDG